MLLRSCSYVAKELLGGCSGTLGAAQELLASFFDAAEELQKWLPLGRFLATHELLSSTQLLSSF